MAEDITRPRVEDLVSVGSRISWGAILAGTVVALALQFLLTVLGTAVGVSLSPRIESDKLMTAAVVWSIVTTCVALFVGGMVVSQFTVGENKLEAMLYGIIMWAVLLVLLLHSAAEGSAMIGMAKLSQPSQTSSAETWEAAALRMGISPKRVQEWRDSLADDKKPATDSTAAAAQDATELAWYAFAGTWLSMLAAALGALVGAGPTFRLAPVGRVSTHIIQ